MKHESVWGDRVYEVATAGHVTMHSLCWLLDCSCMKSVLLLSVGLSLCVALYCDFRPTE